MTHSRRTMLLLGGGLIVGYASIISAGAFDVVTLTRDIDITVESDAEGMFAIEPHPDRTDSSASPTVDYDESGAIFISFDDPLNPDGTTAFHDVLRVKNGGSNEVDVTVTAMINSGTVDDAITVYPDTMPSASIPPLEPGEQQDLGIEVDTSHDGIEEIDRLRFTVEVR